MAALLDSNALIQAKNLFYRFGFCPGFWDWLSVEHARGTLLSVASVKAELAAGRDDLPDWAQKVIPASFFTS